MLCAKAESRASRSYTLCLLRDDAHGDVSRFGGVRKGAYADEVGPRLCEGANIFEYDAAGCFDRNPAAFLADSIDGAFDLLRGHVVEEDCFSAEFERIFEFVLRTNLDLHAIAGLALFKRVHKYSAPAT